MVAVETGGLGIPCCWELEKGGAPQRQGAEARVELDCGRLKERETWLLVLGLCKLCSNAGPVCCWYGMLERSTDSPVVDVFWAEIEAAKSNKFP